jgi:hypothetical protein
MSRYGWFAVALALVNLAWIALTRYQADRRVHHRMTIEARERLALKYATPPVGTSLRITQFYASSGEIVEGEHAVVCYGVENAERVRLYPPVEGLRPATNRCFAVEPERTTTYELVAESQGGAAVSSAFTIAVKPAPPRILFIDISPKVKRGDRAAVCYGVKYTKIVRLDPIGWSLPPMAKYCVNFFPPATMGYTFRAIGADGRKQQEKFKIEVF